MKLSVLVHLLVAVKKLQQSELLQPYREGAGTLLKAAFLLLREGVDITPQIPTLQEGITQQFSGAQGMKRWVNMLL